eukprot:COSAG05_NODE_182_length_14772_cov_42.430655_7_plen_83_part_00
MLGATHAANFGSFCSNIPDTMVDIRPDDVLSYTAPTEGFLCPLDANVWDVEFLAFKIRDAESGKVIAAPLPALSLAIDHRKA